MTNNSYMGNYGNIVGSKFVSLTKRFRLGGYLANGPRLIQVSVASCHQNCQKVLRGKWESCRSWVVLYSSLVGALVVT